MKKGLIVACAVALLGLAAVSSQAATSLNYTLVVTITTAPIDITGPWADGSYIVFGSVGANSFALSTALASPGNWSINNVGSSTVDLSLSLDAPSGNGWSYLSSGDPSSTQPAADQYRMGAMFTQWDRGNIVEADFVANDVLTATPQLCSNTQFAYDSEANANFKGYAIPTGQTRNMFVMIETGPVASATAGNLTPVIHIAASVTP